MSTEQVLGLALGLVAFFGGLWVRTIQSDLKELRDALKDYALREDVRREHETTVVALNRLTDKVDKFLDHLSTKADKT